MAFEKMFEPITIGKTECKNRIAMAPMGVGLYSADETWPRREIRYFEERAKGGIGLLISPFTRVHGELASIPLNGIYDDKFIPSHTEMVERVHKHGCKVILQIALGGGKLGGEAPSSIYSPNFAAKPRALTSDELNLLVQAFIDAAGRGKKAGYDGVEVHGSHSYLIGQMISPATNKRDDEWGGTFEKRMKFPTDIIRGIQKTHPELTVGYKMSAYEAFPGGVDIELAKEIAKYIAGLDIAYMHVGSTSSTIEVYSKYPSVPPLYIDRNTLMPLASEIKKVIPDTPIIGTGSITVPEEAEDFIKNGDCDMVALGRTLLADAHWANRAKEGKRVTPCIRCNVCYHQLWLAGPLWCSVNPYLLHEAEQDIPPAVTKKDVMIVGAGPAGIRCALTASKRGHKVTLYDEQPYVGGMVYPGSRPDCKKDVARLWDWYNAELEESDVEVKLNTHVTPALVDKERPDTLILATGATPVLPELPGIEDSKVATAVDVLRDVSKYKGKKAVVVGGGDVGCETAVHLADNGWDVTIVEILPEILEDNIMTNVKVHMFKMIEDKQITVMTETKANAVTENGLEVILPSGKQWEFEADLIAFAIGMVQPTTFDLGKGSMNIAPVGGENGIMAMKADEVHMIGDCAQLGRIREATEAGERVGRWI